MSQFSKFPAAVLSSTRAITTAAAKLAGPAESLRALAVLDPSAAVSIAIDQAEALASQAEFCAIIRAAASTDATRNMGRLSDEIAYRFFDAWAHLPPDLMFLALRDRSHYEQYDQRIAEALEAFPTEASILKLASERALTTGETGKYHALLNRLGRADATPSTLRFVARARQDVPHTPGTPTTLALLSSYTIDPLVDWLDLECRIAGLVPEISVAPFNTWSTEVLHSDSALGRAAPDAVFLSVAIDDLLPELAGSVTPQRLAIARNEVVDRVESAVAGYFGWGQGIMVVHGMHTAYRGLDGPLEGRASQSRAGWLSEVNLQLAQALQAYPRCYFLDIADLIARRPEGASDNPKMRYLAGMRLSVPMLKELARAYVSYLIPLKGLASKCVVLDLDNTLWGGVVGEDGPHGIRLGRTAPGVEYRDFQHYLRALPSRGILLAVCSKNNPEDALEVIRHHPEMLLREDDFAAMRINWAPKPTNLREIAAELNLGLDSFVFLDDNPDEREQMRQMLPEVLTPDLPRDPARYRESVEILPQLQSISLTPEDLVRTELYHANRKRERTKVRAATLQEYLESLQLAVVIQRAAEGTLPRVKQLFERTNQFNLTTRRYSAAELASFSRDDRYQLLVAHAGDRFGDHGLVATALLRCEHRQWIIDSLLMSCRVIGYGVETALLASLADRARSAGALALTGEFIESKKNAPASSFYSSHGFTKQAVVGEVVTWTRSLSDGGPLPPTWIAVTSNDT